MTDDTDLSNLEPGDVPTAEPIDGVELRWHDLAEGSGTAPRVEAEVRTEDGGLRGIYLYEIVEIEDTDDGERYVCEPDRHSHTKAEQAIKESGGVVA